MPQELIARSVQLRSDFEQLTSAAIRGLNTAEALLCQEAKPMEGDTVLCAGEIVRMAIALLRKATATLQELPEVQS